ncbi:MAG TPA: hypothetical protein VFK04_13105 [Gemmatimonadaceae bacterium]|nr:hypothetical protein [Gemmatimonadaceae bacterium]
MDAIEARANAATPAERMVAQRYDHGGGRLFVDGPILRKLIIDAYHEEDREFYFAARTDIPALVAEVRRLKEAVQDADDARHDALLIAETWEVDAGRYRFLRDNALGFRAVDGAASVPPHPDVMDRWVDAAIAEAAHD